MLTGSRVAHISQSIATTVIGVGVVVVVVKFCVVKT